MELKENISLDDKVDKFIDWYYENLVKDNYTDIGKFYEPNRLRNFIEKMAVWYELRYPNYEVNRLMSGSNQEGISINDVMFRHNLYINEVVDIDSDVKELDWAKFYNAEVFIKSLPWDERYIFVKPKFNNLVYVERGRGARLYLTSEGFVQKSEGFEVYTNFSVNDKELVGKHIKDVLNLLNQKGVVLPKGNQLEESIKKVEKWNYYLEEMLNCVMYRIIERGGKRIGPRRAFIFAKEFNRNIDIPMMYGIDYSDPGLENFIKEYIKAGGSKKLICYVGYFSKTKKDEKINMVSIQEIIKMFYSDQLLHIRRKKLS